MPNALQSSVALSSDKSAQYESASHARVSSVATKIPPNSLMIAVLVRLVYVRDTVALGQATLWVAPFSGHGPGHSMA